MARLSAEERAIIARQNGRKSTGPKNPNHGSIRVNRPEIFEIKFYEKTAYDSSGCLMWIGSKFKHGYGRLRSGDSYLKAHRVAWEIQFGPIPLGLHVCHTCDVRACVNIDHLFLGDHRANMRDMILKKRDLKEKGVDRYNAKLDPDKVRSIRAEYLVRKSCTAIAKDYGVNGKTIWAVVNRKRWKHVE